MLYRQTKTLRDHLQTYHDLQLEVVHLNPIDATPQVQKELVKAGTIVDCLKSNTVPISSYLPLNNGLKALLGYFYPISIFLSYGRDTNFSQKKYFIS